MRGIWGLIWCVTALTGSRAALGNRCFLPSVAGFDRAARDSFAALDGLTFEYYGSCEATCGNMTRGLEHHSVLKYSILSYDPKYHPRSWDALPGDVPNGHKMYEMHAALHELDHCYDIFIGEAEQVLRDNHCHCGLLDLIFSHKIICFVALFVLVAMALVFALVHLIARSIEEEAEPRRDSVLV